ncbi:restriction endonuclease subunit S [Microcoleus sp. ZQ-A2]|nr:restriction endonuclease subunit S [Microcoleus sp. FACHB-1]
MTRHKPYSTYKPSGVEWLGDIPEHWELRKLKYIAYLVYGNSLPLESRNDGDIPVYGSNGIVGSHSLSNTVAPCIIVGRKGSYGKVTFSDQYAFAIDTTYFIDKRSVQTNLVFRWLFYALSSLQLDKNSQDTGVPGLSREFAHGQLLPLPSIQEQEDIATFLDRETIRIDTLITKKCEFIDLLQKKRSATVTHAVTRGLDPQVSMKDSGLEWIDKIPAHWEVKRLKFTADIQTGLTLGKDYKGRNIVNRPYLRVANVQDGFLDLETITEISIPVEDTSRYELKFGDVLMTEGGDFDKLGRGYVWEEQIEGCLHQNHVFAVRPNLEHLDSHYLAALMTSHYGKAYFTSTSQQTTNLATTNRTKLSNFPMPLPDVAEQKNIIDYISKKNQQLLLVIEKLTQQIDTLQKYRSALVSAAITGKIDMSEEANRGVA